MRHKETMSIALANQLFRNDAFSVDVVFSDGKHFFRATDVTRALGYGNSSQAIRHHVRSKYVTSKEALQKVSRNDIPSSRDDAALYLCEPGLYQILMKSHKPEAEAFQDWVFEDVLPQLRATGQYAFKRSCNKLQLQLMNEADLHHKVVDFIRTFHPEALLVAGLGENQDTDVKRIDSWRKGYTKGQCDLMLMNRNAKFSGLAFEFKTPANTGRVSPEQRRFMDELVKAGFRVLLSNHYDAICNEIRDYFRTIRSLCQECGKWIRATALEAHLMSHSLEGTAAAQVDEEATDSAATVCPF